MIRLTRLLTGPEHRAIGQASVDAGGFRNGPKAFPPGSAWLCPWYFDPADPDNEEKIGFRRRGEDGKSFLSIHYWRDWSTKRSPITVVCPNGHEWCIDQGSSNGDGWKVTGEFPNLTAHPSIIAGDYHGFLRDGAFTPDLDGKNWPHLVARTPL